MQQISLSQATLIASTWNDIMMQIYKHWGQIARHKKPMSRLVNVPQSTLLSAATSSLYLFTMYAIADKYPGNHKKLCPILSMSHKVPF